MKLNSNDKKYSILSDVKSFTSNSKPVIAITHIGCENNYCFVALVKKNRNAKENMAELQRFIKKFKEFEIIEDAITYFVSHNKCKNSDEYSLKIKKSLNIEQDIIHLHTKGGGCGKYTIHGFQIENRFEIVMIDPEHKMFM